MSLIAKARPSAIREFKVLFSQYVPRHSFSSFFFVESVTKKKCHVLTLARPLTHPIVTNMNGKIVIDIVILFFVQLSSFFLFDFREIMKCCSIYTLKYNIIFYFSIFLFPREIYQ